MHCLTKKFPQWVTKYFTVVQLTTERKLWPVNPHLTCSRHEKDSPSPLTKDQEALFRHRQRYWFCYLSIVSFKSFIIRHMLSGCKLFSVKYFIFFLSTTSTERITTFLRPLNTLLTTSVLCSQIRISQHEEEQENPTMLMLDFVNFDQFVFSFFMFYPARQKANNDTHSII